MKGRRVIVGLVVLALVAVVGVALWPRGPRPCRETFEQVREGMTYDEVVATVGALPGDYTAGEYAPTAMVFLSFSWKTWLADGVELTIWLDDDRVTWLSVQPLHRYIDIERALRPSPWSRLRARLGL